MSGKQLFTMLFLIAAIVLGIVAAIIVPARGMCASLAVACIAAALAVEAVPAS